MVVFDKMPDRWHDLTLEMQDVLQKIDGSKRELSQEETNECVRILIQNAQKLQQLLILGEIYEVF